MRWIAAVVLLLGIQAFAQAATPAARKHHQHVMQMQATAYVPGTKATASGTVPHRGTVAADPSVLPLGSRIRVSGAGIHSGVYTVTDTGRKINGRQIDLCLPTVAQARSFGKKVVLVRLLETGEGAEDAREKDIPAPKRMRRP
jgi:3D (Asp-Asp-Asp) domain-containing protein